MARRQLTIELLASEFARAGVPALVAVNTAAGRPLLCAIVEPDESEPVELARAARAELGGEAPRGTRRP